MHLKQDRVCSSSCAMGSHVAISAQENARGRQKQANQRAEAKDCRMAHETTRHAWVSLVSPKELVNCRSIGGGPHSHDLRRNATWAALPSCRADLHQLLAHSVFCGTCNRGTCSSNKRRGSEGVRWLTNLRMEKPPPLVEQFNKSLLPPYRRHISIWDLPNTLRNQVLA